jgi:hypothetical protein
MRSRRMGRVSAQLLRQLSFPMERRQLNVIWAVFSSRYLSKEYETEVPAGKVLFWLGIRLRSFYGRNTRDSFCIMREVVCCFRVAGCDDIMAPCEAVLRQERFAMRFDLVLFTTHQHIYCILFDRVFRYLST